jgi:hypothetical protein
LTTVTTDCRGDRFSANGQSSALSNADAHQHPDLPRSGRLSAYPGYSLFRRVAAWSWHDELIGRLEVAANDARRVCGAGVVVTAFPDA